MRPIVGGNWKMNTDRAGATALANEVSRSLAADAASKRADVVLFPPFPYLLDVRAALESSSAQREILLGAQDCYHQPNGAFTGEVSLEMLADCGVDVVLVGHSERRHVLCENDELIRAKVVAALDPKWEGKAGPGRGGFLCNLCVGETLEQRTAGQTDSVNERQLRAALRGVTASQMARVVIAYEPVWAIGTGKTATPEDARLAHKHVRTILEEMYGTQVAEQTRIQYGGSVKASNARELFCQPGVNGGLIGGASLKAEEFCGIVRAALA